MTKWLNLVANSPTFELILHSTQYGNQNIFYCNGKQLCWLNRHHLGNDIKLKTVLTCLERPTWRASPVVSSKTWRTSPVEYF